MLLDKGPLDKMNKNQLLLSTVFSVPSDAADSITIALYLKRFLTRASRIVPVIKMYYAFVMLPLTPDAVVVMADFWTAVV